MHQRILTTILSQSDICDISSLCMHGHELLSSRVWCLAFLCRAYNVMFRMTHQTTAACEAAVVVLYISHLNSSDQTAIAGGRHVVKPGRPL